MKQFIEENRGLMIVGGIFLTIGLLLVLVMTLVDPFQQEEVKTEAPSGAVNVDRWVGEKNGVFLGYITRVPEKKIGIKVKETNEVGYGEILLLSGRDNIFSQPTTSAITPQTVADSNPNAKMIKNGVLIRSGQRAISYSFVDGITVVSEIYGEGSSETAKKIAAEVSERR